MHKYLKVALFSAALLSLSCLNNAMAQGPGGWGGGGGPGGGFRGGGPGGDRGGGDRGGDRGGGDRGGGDRGGDRGADRGRDRGGDRNQMSMDDRRKWFFQRLDQNGDGKVERSEVTDDRMWGWFERTAKEAGLDTSKAITMDGFMQAKKNQDRDKLQAENPTSFIAPVESQKVPGFDTPLSETELVLLNPDKDRPLEVTAEASSSEGRSRFSRGERPSFGRDGGSSSNLGDRAQSFAKDLMDKYDKDKNSFIEGGEYNEMPNADRYDANKDKKINLPELEQYARGGDNGGGSSGRFSRGGRFSSRDEAPAHSTYRFTNALDRLPRDARSWIERYDSNQDGQVAMSEFSSSWSDSKVREFERYDLNGDGIVTGDEYVTH